MRELFPGQNFDEKIFIAVREHPVLLALRILVWVVFVILYFVYRHYIPESFPSLYFGIGGTIIAVIEQIYILFLALSLFVLFVIYYLNLNIVTDLRIVDINQVGLFKHEVSTLNINQIEDVTSDTAGILGTLFDFGTIYIQTAGTRERFEFTNIPHPGRLSKIIIDLFEEEQKKNNH